MTYWVVTPTGKHGCWSTFEQAQAQADGFLNDSYSGWVNKVYIMKEVAVRERVHTSILKSWVIHEPLEED